MRRLAAVLVFSVVLVLTAGTALAWYAPVEGMPTAMQQWEARGFFVWHDGDGMHVRVRSGVMPAPFSGTVKTDGVFTAVHGQKLEYGDHYWLEPGKKTLHFKFQTAGAVDGLDFKVMGGTHLAFSLMADGAPAEPAEIYLGHDGWRPSSSHFMLRR